MRSAGEYVSSAFPPCHDDEDAFLVSMNSCCGHPSAGAVAQSSSAQESIAIIASMREGASNAAERHRKEVAKFQNEIDELVQQGQTHMRELSAFRIVSDTLIP